MFPPVARGATIWLVGMMGAGKSTVGAALALRLGTRLVDTDRDIASRAGASVAELFAREGEAGFRRREREAVERVAGKPVVVALGGGAMAQPGAPARLGARGTVVYLRARPGTLATRVGDAVDRPLLSGVEPAEREARLGALLAEREPFYAQAAIQVDTDERSVEDVVEEIVERLEGQG